MSKLSDAGGDVLVPPYELMGGSFREAVVRDPQGAVLSLSQPPGAA